MCRWYLLKKEQCQDQPISKLFLLAPFASRQLVFHIDQQPHTPIVYHAIHGDQRILHLALCGQMRSSAPCYTCDSE